MLSSCQPRMAQGPPPGLGGEAVPVSDPPCRCQGSGQWLEPAATWGAAAVGEAGSAAPTGVARELAVGKPQGDRALSRRPCHISLNSHASLLKNTGAEGRGCLYAGTEGRAGALLAECCH